MVVITAPQSAVVPRGNVTLSWSPEYPQTAYEILYRRKGDTSWSTMGREVSSSTSVTLNLEHFENFLEYHYRVVCYSENTEVNATIYDGNDTSAAYAIVVVPANQVGQLRVQYGDGMVEVPIYEDDNYTVLPKVNTGSGGTIGVVENDEITASKIRVLDDSEKVMSLASSQANFVELHESNYAYMELTRNYQYYYEYNNTTEGTYTYTYNKYGSRSGYNNTGHGYYTGYRNDVAKYYYTRVIYATYTFVYYLPALDTSMSTTGYYSYTINDWGNYAIHPAYSSIYYYGNVYTYYYAIPTNDTKQYSYTYTDYAQNYVYSSEIRYI